VVQGSFVWEPLLLAPTDFHMAVLIGHSLTGDRKAGAHHLKDIAAAVLHSILSLSIADEFSSEPGNYSNFNPGVRNSQFADSYCGPRRPRFVQHLVTDLHKRPYMLAQIDMEACIFNEILESHTGLCKGTTPTAFQAFKFFFSA